MLLMAIGLFLVVRHYGEQLTPSQRRPSRPANRQSLPSPTSCATSSAHSRRFCSWAAGSANCSSLRPAARHRRDGGRHHARPVAAGRISPEAMHFVLPPEVGPYLGIIAQLGVILYMFLVGLELNAGLLRSRAHATVAISHASIVAPFCSVRFSRYGSIPSSRRPTCRSPASLCSWAWRCRSPPFPSSRGFSPIGRWTRPSSASSR